jgi:hypothetical protein
LFSMLFANAMYSFKVFSARAASSGGRAVLSGGFYVQFSKRPPGAIWQEINKNLRHIHRST